MLFANVLLAISSVLSLCLGLLILISNPRRAVNRTLTAFIAGVFIWLVTNLLTNVSATPSEALFFGRSTFIGPVILAYCFLLFAKVYSNTRDFGYRQALKLAIVPLLLLLLTPTNLNVSSIKAYGQDTVTGPAYLLLVGLLLVYFIWGFRVLLHYYRSTPDTVTKAQIRYVFSGIVLALIPGLLTNGVLPLLGHSNAVYYGPNSVILLAFMMSLAIVRHQLLNIRLIVARSLAYILSLGSLAVVFTLGTFTVSSIFFKNQDLSSSFIRWVYTVLAIVLAFIFPSFKRFFDKVTGRLFFRDAYDTQAFLDDFNKVLVATYELTPLLKKSSKIIEDNLKPAFTVFGLKETESAPRRIMGTAGHPAFTEDDIMFVRSLTPKMKRKLIVTDLLEDKFSDLQKMLRANDIAVIARLASATNEEGIGYLVLGPKKSGNLYSGQDLGNIEIIANELVIAIQNALRFEEIENFNLTLQGKVDEATRNLRKANERLKELDETKDDFISMASHQLRTPLTSVKGYISMVLEGDAGKLNDTQRKLLEQSFFSSQRMVFLIADLLNVSRLKTGKFIIEPAPVNLADMVEQEMDQLRETAAGKELTLSYEKPEHFPTLMLDETKTRQVIMNFADNAIYYTPQGGHIRVELSETPASVELRIVDDGIGVPKQEQHHLFTKFYRAGNARKARPDGTGLGLFMAKKVIVAQGGALVFESEEGEGSTFGFVFSKTKLAPSGKPTPKAKQTVKT